MHRSFLFSYPKKCVFLNISFYSGDWAEVWTKSGTHYPTQPFSYPYHTQSTSSSQSEAGVEGWAGRTSCYAAAQGRPRGSEGQEEGPQPSEPFQGGFQKKEEGHTLSWEDWDYPAPSLCTLGPHHFRVVYDNLPRAENCYIIPDW